MLRRTSDPVRAVLLAGALVAGWLLFRQLATLIGLLVLTLVIAIPVEAATTRLNARGVPRAVGAALTLLAGLALLAGLLALIIPPFVSELQDFVNAVPAILRDLQDRLHDASGAETGHRLREGLQGYIDDPLALLGPIASIGLGVAGVAGTLIVILITAYYVSSRPEPLVSGVLSLFPARRQAAVRDTLDEIRAAWIGWLQGVAVDMAVTGVLLYIGLELVGLDYAIVFAVFAALLVVVPYLGSLASAVPPVAFALADSPGRALVVLGVYIAVQQVESNLIVPLVMARAVRIHPAAIVIGVVIVGRVLGFAGLFVAVPIIAAILILVRRLWTEPLQRVDEPGSTSHRSVTPRRGVGELEHTLLPR